MSRIFTFFIEHAILKFYFSTRQQIHKINPRLIRKGYSTPSVTESPIPTAWLIRRDICFSRFPQNLLTTLLDILVVFHIVDKGHHLKVNPKTLYFPGSLQRGNHKLLCKTHRLKSHTGVTHRSHEKQKLLSGTQSSDKPHGEGDSGGVSGTFLLSPVSSMCWTQWQG